MKNLKKRVTCFFKTHSKNYCSNCNWKCVIFIGFGVLLTIEDDYVCLLLFLFFMVIVYSDCSFITHFFVYAH